MSPSTKSAAKRALDRFGNDPKLVMQMLRDVQLSEHWISPDAIEVLSEALDLTRAQLTALTDFYSFLHEKPRGDYVLYLSDSITDRMLGSNRTAAVLREALQLSPEGESADGLVSLAMTSCTGLCELGPALIANGHAIQRVDEARAREIAGLIASRVPVADWPAEWKTIDDTLERKGPLLGAALTPGAAIERAMRIGPHLAIAELEVSGLRGCGGAGFPVHRKWELCGSIDTDQRYVVCNADEGEPGTSRTAPCSTATPRTCSKAWRPAP